MENREIRPERLEELVEEYMPYLVRTVSGITGRYVSVRHDDEFSVALAAFGEAVEKYDPARGPFTAFVGLVVQSRLRSYLSREGRHTGAASLEELAENGQEPRASDTREDGLREELLIYKEALLKLGLTLDKLADCTPKHRNTRLRALSIAKRAAGDGEIVRQVDEKRKLPVRAVSRCAGVSEKVVKDSKTYILGTMPVFIHQLTAIMAWIGEVR